MPNMLWPFCAAIGHDFSLRVKTKNWLHYECYMCGAKKKLAR